MPISDLHGQDKGGSRFKIQACLVGDANLASAFLNGKHPGIIAALDRPFQTITGQVRIGEEATRNSVIEDVAEKQGRSGPLVFVTIRHEITCAGTIAITDRQTIVYRGEGGGGPPTAGKPAPGECDFSRAITPSAALLFRYSALIFNAHRIHYDHPFTTQIEGYPGLVVHGPLLATLLADLVRRVLPIEAITRFRFRAVKPVFDDAPFTICGRRDGENTVVLWVRDSAGDHCVDAAAELG